MDLSSGVVEVTTAIGCKVLCRFCPQKKLLQAYTSKDRVMSFQTFASCLGNIPRTYSINFSGFCEPFQNPACREMVEYAFSQGHKVSLYTTLQGMSMEDWDILKKYHFNCLCLHLPDAEGRCNIRIDENYMLLLKEVLKYQHLQFCFHGTRHPSIKELVPDRVFGFQNRAGNLEGCGGEIARIDGPVYCKDSGSNFNWGVLLPDGSIVLCCMDYALKHPFGNLLEQSYIDILNSSIVHEFRSKALHGGDILCRTCSGARRG